MSTEDGAGTQPPKRPAKYNSAFRQADSYVGVGFQVAIALVFYVLVGNWLDGRLGTAPWLTVLGAVLGFVSMLFLLVRFAARQSTPKRRGSSDSERQDSSGG